MAVDKAVTIRIEGLATLDKALRDLPVAVQRDVLAPALTAGGEVIKRGVADRIRNRTGRTDADLRVSVEMREKDVGGVAKIGGSKREHILRFLEFGTKPHAIPKRRRGAKRVLLTDGGRVFGSRVQHPGMTAQSPLRSALRDEGARAVQAFARRAWSGIVQAANRLKARG
jgi:HK97 gp10 family phage protein